MEINEEVASRVLTVVDQGLCKGVGRRIPGQMCVEAALCYALGDRLDERVFVEKLNEVVITKLLPKILRSAAALQQEPHKSKLLEAANRCETEGTAAAAAAARWAAANAFSTAAPAVARWLLMTAAADARWAADADADAAAADELLAEFAEQVVQILVEMKTPGSKFLCLTQ